MFTIRAVARYALGMVIVAAAALVATLVPQARAPVTAERQAQVTVTILSSASLRFSEIEQAQPKRLRETIVRSAGGSNATIRLVEFE